MLRRIDPTNIPHEFELVQKIVFQSKSLFVPYSMSFLDVPNKHGTQPLTVLSTNTTQYLFFQRFERSLLHEAGRRYNEYYGEKFIPDSRGENNPQVFLPCSASLNYFMQPRDYIFPELIQYHEYPWNHVHMSLFPLDINKFYKKHIRIPDYIIDGLDYQKYIFVYEEENIDKNFNIISLYFGLRDTQYMDLSDINERSCRYFGHFLQWAEKNSKYCNGKKNIIDIHFINNFLKNAATYNEIRRALRDCNTENFIVRSIFDEHCGDFSRQENKLVRQLMQRLTKKKQLRESFQEPDIRYIQDIISYVIDGDVENGLRRSAREKIIQLLFDNTSVKKVEDILNFQKLKPQIELLCSTIRWWPHVVHLIKDDTPLLFQTKFYFLWYFKHILFSSALTIFGLLLLKHRTFINEKFKQLWVTLAKKAGHLKAKL